MCNVHFQVGKDSSRSEDKANRDILVGSSMCCEWFVKCKAVVFDLEIK